MINIAAQTASAILGLLATPSGADIRVNVVAQGFGSGVSISPASLSIGNLPADLLEHSQPLRYPTFCVYCEKLQNTQEEKFRIFSGTARFCIEIRHSQDHLHNLQQAIESCAAAVCSILDAHRGDWSGGLFYSGGYEVQFSPVKRGGRSFIQTAKVILDIAINI